MVEMLTFELDIPRFSLGSTTYFENTLEKGLEPDECYYIANEALVRGKNRIDLTIDPPPDLAIEIDISYRAIKRESIYAAMKVPEVWRYDGKQIDCLVLNESGTYDIVPHSKAFPFLPVPELKRFMDMVPQVGENTMLRAFRDWVLTLAR
jgi:Uma2 family endonuclease